MGVFDGFLNMMQLATDDDDDDDDFNRGYEDEEPVRKQKNTQRREPEPVRTVADKRPSDTRNTASRPAAPAGRVAPVRTSPVAKRVNTSTGQIAVCIMQPKTYDDGREVSDLLKEGNPVFLNLEGVEFELAQRIIDFVSGSCFALEGSLQRISNYNFLFSPKNVPINGINIDMMDTFEFNGIRSDF